MAGWATAGRGAVNAKRSTRRSFVMGMLYWEGDIMSEYTIISVNDIAGFHPAGERYRGCCPVHNGDNPSSLSVLPNGFGYCFRCNVKVLVKELNEEAATNLLRRQQGLPYAFPRGSSSRPAIPQQSLLVSEPSAFQKAEWEKLNVLYPRMQKAMDWAQSVHSYLSERRNPLTVAHLAGVGYLSSKAVRDEELDGLLRWRGRLVFPLYRPAAHLYSQGFIGRSLWHWKPGMDEDTHKLLLDQPKTPKRWIKTNPAGWFYDPLNLDVCVVLVEGAFDVLALLSASAFFGNVLHPGNVIGLCGTAARADWLLPRVRAVVLALDGDKGGQEAIVKLREALAAVGVRVYACPPSADGRGKDWSARWRLSGIEGVRSVFDAYHFARSEVAA
jgi:Toprim-like